MAKPRNEEYKEVQALAGKVILCVDQCSRNLKGFSLFNAFDDIEMLKMQKEIEEELMYHERDKRIAREARHNTEPAG